MDLISECSLQHLALKILRELLRVQLAVLPVCGVRMICFLPFFPVRFISRSITPKVCVTVDPFVTYERGGGSAHDEVFLRIYGNTLRGCLLTSFRVSWCVCVLLTLKKSFGFYISVVNSTRRNVLQEGWDSVSQNWVPTILYVCGMYNMC
jgi:hypothetical protein